MDVAKNPFSPGAGEVPAALVGRSEVLERMQVCARRLQLGRTAKSFFVLGLRGVGKTVLLNQMELIAQQHQHHCLYVEVHEKQNLVQLLTPHLHTLINNLKTGATNLYIQKALVAFQTFVQAFKLKYYDIELGVELKHTPPTNKSTGDVELDLPPLLIQLAQAAQSHNQAMVLVVDEMQLLSSKEISAIVMALHRCAQLQLPLVLMAAGLPDLLTKVGRSKSYAERLFDAVEIGSLSQSETLQALKRSTQNLGVRFESAAAQSLYNKTQGYPYFVQEWGYHAWNTATKPHITLKDISVASRKAMQNLDKVFFKMRFERLTSGEKKYLLAMAACKQQPSSSGLAAQNMKLTPQQAAPIRASLIRKGIIYSPARGLNDFTVPLFDTFIRRHQK